MNGTGKPMTQPATRMALREYRPVSAPPAALGDRLGEPEDHDERRDGDLAEVELLSPDQRGDGALGADQPADEEVHHREEEELAQVGPQSQPDVRPVGGGKARADLPGHEPS
jgi:hypothetical protein